MTLASHIVPEAPLLHDLRDPAGLHLPHRAVAFLDLGALNTVVALAIAIFKATLVVLFFMHVKYSTRLTWAVVARQRLLARHPAGADAERLPDARLAHVRIKLSPRRSSADDADCAD